MKITTALICSAVIALVFSSCDKPPAAAGPARWSLEKMKSFEKVSLRGFDVVSGELWGLAGAGTILQIDCENKSKAELTQAKYLSDLQLLPKVKPSYMLDGSKKILMIEAEGQGLIAALQYDKKVFVISAHDQKGFKKLYEECIAANGESFSSKPQVEVPMWLDRWDKYGFRFYYRPGEVPAGKDLTTYDVLQEFDFAEKSDRSGFLFWCDQNAVDTAEGLNNEQYWNFAQQAATQRKLPIALNLTLGDGTWLYNRYREQTEVKAPQYCGNSYPGVAEPGAGSKGHFSWSSTSGKDAELAVCQKLVREMIKLPNVTTILEPHGELSHRTEIFMEYGPLADVTFREFLKAKYNTISALQKAWNVSAASWAEIRVPEVASFLGWTGDAIDLKGEWKVGYETFANGKTYSLNDLQSGLHYQSIPTEPAPSEWTAEKFDDSAWPSVVAPGHDRAMFVPKRPAVYRRTFTVPQDWLAKHPRSWIYVWDLNSGSGSKVRVFLNGKPLGESTIIHNDPHFCVMDTAGALRAGGNQLSISLPKGLLGYRVYLTADEPKQYPNFEEGKNTRWADFMAWSIDTHVAMVRRGAEMIRQVEPNRQIDFMAPGDYVDGIVQIAKTYGGNVKNTGYMQAFFADILPATMRGVGLAFSLESAGPARNLPDFKRTFGLWQTEGIQGADYFIHVGDILWNPEIKKHFEGTLPLIKLIGKYHAPKAEIAMLHSALGVAQADYPWGKDWNTNLRTGYWAWNVRGHLMGLYESDMLTESSFASGDAARYRVIIDSNSSIMDEAIVSQIERYVRAGGIFITLAQTGRHTSAKKDAWPISRLTGYEVTKIDRMNPEGTPAETRMLVPAAGQQVFSGDWNVPANGLSLKKVSPDAKDLMMWADGSTAVGVRPLGKGFIYEVGSKFTGMGISDRLEGPPNRETAALIQLFSQLLQACDVAKIEARLAPNNYKLVLRHYLSNNGIYDVWVIWNRDKSQAGSTELVLPSNVTSSWAWDVQAKMQVPISGGKLSVNLEPLDYQIFLTPRNEITKAPSEWFELQRSWWQGTTPPPAKVLPALSKFSMDLSSDWAFKPLASGEAVSPELLTSDTAALEKIRFGVWSATHPNIKHALLRKSFTIPKEWAGGKVGLWLKLWWGQTFYDKGRVWLDGKPVRDASGDGFTDFNPDHVLQPGTTHSLAVEIEGNGSLVGSRSPVWLWVWPKPLQVLDLAGAWNPSNDLLSYGHAVQLPGKCDARSFRRTITVPETMAANNVVLDVDAEGGRGVMGVIVNGYYIGHDLAAMHFQINMTPWIQFGKENEIELVCFSKGPVAIKNVSLETHPKGIYP